MLMRINLGQKIILTFVAGIFFIAGIGLFAYHDLNRIVDKLVFVEASDDLSNSILEVRRFEKNYLLYRDRDSDYSLKTELDNTGNLIESLREEAASAEVDATRLDHLSELLATYSTAMLRVKELFSEQDATAAQIVAIAPEARAKLRDVPTADASRMTAEMERQSQKPEVLRDRDYVRQAVSLAQTVRNQQAATEAAAPLDSYLSYFPRLLNNFDEADSQVTLVREEGRQMQDVSREISHEQRLGVADILSSSKRTIIYAAVVLLVAGVVLGRMVARRIAVPLTRLAEGTRKIAGGEFTPIEGIHSHDEVGTLVESFNQMGIELKEKQEQLIQAKKLASLGTLTSGVAHELNNPLSNISTSAQILLEEIDEDDREHKRKLLNDIESQTERAEIIVRNLLDFAREREPDYRVQDIGAIVAAAMDLLGNQARLINIEQELKLSPSLPPVKVDERQLQQVFVNLILNAVQAMPDGGKLEIETGLAASGQEVQVTVTDSGHGIAPENIPRVFDPFFTTKEVGAGTGLGLSVSYGIVEKHGGHISVESEVGRGTTFTVILAVSPEKPRKG